MELSRNSSVDKTRKLKGVGRCRHFFWLGVVFETVGATVLLTGVFADLLYCDLLLYLGSIILFLSLPWWVFWYTGNIEGIPEEALKRPRHVPAASMVGAPSHSLTVRLCKVPNSLRQVGPGWPRRGLLRRNASLNMTVSGQVEKQQLDDEEDSDAYVINMVKKRSQAEGLGGEDLGPNPEAVRRSKGVGATGPGSGPRCSEVRVLQFVECSLTHRGPPEVTSSLDQPLAPAILTSVVGPTGQPLASLTSKALPVVPLASASHPPATPAPANLPAVSVSSAGQPLDMLASKSQAAAMVASQNQALVSVAAESHLRAPVAVEGNLQNLSPAPQPVQASQAQTLATPVTLIQLLPTPSSQTQLVDLRVTSAVRDLQVQFDTRQAPQSNALVQEMALGQSSAAQESAKQPVAQASQTVPPMTRELSQRVPNIKTPLPESPAPAVEVQQPLSPENASTPTSGKDSHPL